MKKLGAGALLLTALLLTACGATTTAGEPTPTPTQTVNPNVLACENFSTETSFMRDAITGANAIEGWANLRDAIDTTALKAQGDVKARLSKLVDEWPEASSIVVYRDFDGINANIEAVARACEADGQPIQVHTFSTN